MAIHVVNFIRYGSSTGYAKSHTTVQVPDSGDLEKKADKTSVDKNISELKDRIDAEVRERYFEDEKLSGDISTVKTTIASKAGKEELKNILSAASLEAVKSSLRELLDKHISLIQQETKKSHESHQKDIIAFENAAHKVNQELEKKFNPINTSIELFNTRIEQFVKTVEKIPAAESKISAAHREAEKITQEMQALKHQVQSLVTNECKRQVNEMMNQRFSALKKQFLSDLEEREESKKGFWRRLFS